eukprot:CAMPEP_0201570786 /NCGR_PEP_ID=MMETSP0190_2-20130828/13190_1 /ASSEMBLY_ACC=CAM_ASM_000263 /TAXON_ID=37353 /ORGANISM="Rosalina sp." /LENGTH=221 /DNA_ID=CAMNT_0047994691 /DNA_START=351 /DNA_END=1013 /DNA_ORIENTATION=+
MKAAIKSYILTPPPKTQQPHANGAVAVKVDTNTTQAVSVQSSESVAQSTGSGDNGTPNSTEEHIDEHIDEEPAADMLGINPGGDANVTYSGDEDTTVDEIKDDYDEITLQDAINLVQQHGDVTIFNDELAKAIQYIWKNEAKVKEGFRMEVNNKNKILDETTQYFWDEIDRIKAEDYVPNETDIINVRYRTTGVIEKRFEINNAKFHIFDVGGQKSERKKW